MCREIGKGVEWRKTQGYLKIIAIFHCKTLIYILVDIQLSRPVSCPSGVQLV